MEILTTRKLYMEETIPSKPFYQRVHHIHKTILTIQGKYEYQQQQQQDCIVGKGWFK